MNGYRKMISDNIPKTWDIALRFCKCRTLWIEYVYITHVKKYNNDWRSSHERSRLKARACKQFTGKVKDDFGNYTSFVHTINTDKMRLEDPESYKAWRRVIKWVEWFRINLKYFEDSIDGKSDTTECINILKDRYSLNKRTATFIVKYLRKC